MIYLAFNYRNWKGERYDYVIEPTGAGYGMDDYNRGRPVLHGEVVTRDGDVREDMWPTRRRTFVLSEMKAVKEVDR